jgi:excinuclease ABC subunit A
MPSKKAARQPAPTGAPECIRLRGVRQNNLKGFDLDLPLGKLIVVTGLSGSGKSSLAFETLYAEGQRRYIETFSPYARQFFDRMDKPAVDRIENIPPAIAIEQRNAVRTTRSTVGTMTEICDHMKVLWPNLAKLYCRKCDREVRRESPDLIWKELSGASGDAKPADVLISFDLPLSDKLSVAEQLALLSKQGFQRVLVDADVARVDDAERVSKLAGRKALTVVADRVKISAESRTRFVEACEQAYHFGQGKLAIHGVDSTGKWSRAVGHFSSGYHCATCDLDYPDPTPPLFSFNHPVGACPICKGFGRVITIDPNLALPDRSKTLAGGVVKPWQTETGADCQADLMRSARKRGVPTDVPFNRLSEEHQRWVMEGDPDHDPEDPEHSWPKSWYGVKGYFRWLESKAYKMHVRVLLSRYRSYRTCRDCGGKRFKPESLLYRWTPSEGGARIDLAGFYALPVRDSLALIEGVLSRLQLKRNDPLGTVFNEVRTRLAYLAEVGLGYLTLDRATRTLSGGETGRVNLTTCLGTRLVNTLYVLDEPSVGLHPRDTARLIGILERLRNLGNTVVVVEHEAGVMRAADQLLDIGPGHGETGGNVVFQGPASALRTAGNSLTADYLTGRREIEVPRRRPVNLARLGGGGAERRATKPEVASMREQLPSGYRTASTPSLVLRHARANNLRDVSVEIPLGRLVCLGGVSGSGKTTLIREVLLPLLQARLAGSEDAAALEDEVDGESIEEAREGLQSAELEGAEHLGAVVLVDQSPLGRTPRSNPAVYIGAFDDIRDFFASSATAKEQGLQPGHFSFNSALGQCERCRGAGFEKIEMQFLSDVFIRCPVCQGRRYRDHVAAVKVKAPNGVARSIPDLLDSPVEEALKYLEAFPDSKQARRAVEKLRLLAEVGLGYLRLGQAINTLSGGESQRLKLVSHLAQAPAAKTKVPDKLAARLGKEALAKLAPLAKPTLFLFDEPTTGLHFEDVRILLAVFQRLVNQGHSVLVIEHNLEVIKSADWVIDLGPEAGDQGGHIVAAGPPEHVAAVEESRTGKFLGEVL